MTVESVYGQIDEQRAVLVGLLNSPSPVPPTRLSDVCMKLSILNELLGDFVVSLKQQQLEAETNTFAAFKGSATAANLQMRVDTISERSAWQKADMKHTDLWKLISMAQSHIRASSEELRNG